MSCARSVKRRRSAASDWFITARVAASSSASKFSGAPVKASATASMAAAGAYGWIPGILRVKLGVSEVITSLVMNNIAILFMIYVGATVLLLPAAKPAGIGALGGLQLGMFACCCANTPSARSARSA